MSVTRNQNVTRDNLRCARCAGGLVYTVGLTEVHRKDACTRQGQAHVESPQKTQKTYWSYWCLTQRLVKTPLKYNYSGPQKRILGKEKCNSDNKKSLMNDQAIKCVLINNNHTCICMYCIYVVYDSQAFSEIWRQHHDSGCTVILATPTLVHQDWKLLIIIIIHLIYNALCIKWMISKCLKVKSDR